jgi:hypothetical protein
MPEDTKEARGHGVRAKRANSGRGQLRSSRRGGESCSGPVNRSERSRPRSPRHSPNSPTRKVAHGHHSRLPPARKRSDLPLRRALTGLDIVRKSLGGHEIATVQTMAIEREAGLIRLTTVLAHSSGDWRSSEWPVCAISKTTALRQMGAALTYASDLRAEPNPPHVNGSAPPGSPISPSRTIPSRAAPPAAAARPIVRIIRPVKPILADEESAQLRDRLIAELDDLPSADEAANWVHRRSDSALGIDQDEYPC